MSFLLFSHHPRCRRLLYALWTLAFVMRKTSHACQLCRSGGTGRSLLFPALSVHPLVQGMNVRESRHNALAMFPGWTREPLVTLGQQKRTIDAPTLGNMPFESGDRDSMESPSPPPSEPKIEEKDNKEGELSNDDVSTAMIGSIRFYKTFISPLLPPACRFVPTCSQYGVQAIQQFGPVQGGILTAWRIARCSPLGGRGYDPPQWPPVSYTYRSY
jgi:uncharacterized protein